MNDFLVPTAFGAAELVEKRSRFLGHVFLVETEAEARARVDEIKKKHYDARHHCWCYRLRADGTERCSDDGEPQGTAGQPMLNVFQREGVENVCCVVTRYFGGILLGAGGLVRAYAQSAKDALDAAGISAVLPWITLTIPCPYHLFERMKREVERAGGLVGETDYAQEITLRSCLPDAAVEGFLAAVSELTAGGVVPAVTGTVLRAVPRSESK